ncbi:MAG: glycosyltransferase family 4 protein [Burkholderiaceae bacterium]|jgi:glycosyltransferase involved in cell wall biosynthesis|nr:MAG: glycosyltransferase family 4 protein [Burkholderiaceae bacterium]
MRFPMVIFLVSNTAWSIYNFRNGLIAKLVECGHRVAVVAPQDEFSERLAAMGCQVIDMPMSAKGANPVEDTALVFRFTRLYKKLRPDFVFHYTIKPNIYGSFAARLARVPCIAVTTGLGYTFINNNWVARVSRRLYKLAFQSPKEVWFLNEDDRQAFLLHGLVSSDKAVLLHGEGVNTDYFSSRAKPLDDGRTRFLLIARMLWDKGVGEFVEAARQVRKIYPDAVFQLLGECDVPNPSVISREQMAEWAQEGVIEYLGVTGDVRPHIAQVDCLVLPSYREGISRTLLEAAAMGKPLIATDAVGCRDVVVDGKTGWLCPVKDAAALAECMKRLIAMPAREREAMGQAGRRFIELHFDEKKVIGHYMATLARYGFGAISGEQHQKCS